MPRITVELDEQLVARAQEALQLDSVRATVEEALRQVVERADPAVGEQRVEWSTLRRLADRDVLASDEMWR